MQGIYFVFRAIFHEICIGWRLSKCECQNDTHTHTQRRSTVGSFDRTRTVANNLFESSINSK